MLRRAHAAASRAVSARGVSSLTLDQPLAGLPTLAKAGDMPAPSTLSTTLPNGLRVVSQEDYGQSASLGLYVDAGSRFESDENAGVSHFAEHLAFKSTTLRSSLRIVRDVELFGGVVSSNSSREYLSYHIDVLRNFLPESVSTLAECVALPKLAKWDVDDAREVVGWELDGFERDPAQVVAEVVHAAAFGDDDPLGRSLWCPRSNLGNIDSAKVSEFRAKLWSPERMVLAAAGVEHAELVSLVERSELAKMTRGVATVEAPKSVYSGGERRVRNATADLLHFTLAFHVDGGWNAKDLVPLCVLHMLLGGGSAFSPGGPGKGMYSRLYTNVLNKQHFAESAAAYNSLFNDTGLLGVSASCEPAYGKQLLEAIVAELKATTTKITPEELGRAKNQLRSSVSMNLESRSVLQEDIGRQVLSYGAREDPKALAKKIAAVTAADVSNAAKKLLKSKPTLAACGNVSSLPSYEDICKMV